MTTIFDRRLVTVEEARLITGISRATLYRRMDDGALNYRLVAGKRRIIFDSLKAFAGI